MKESDILDILDVLVFLPMRDIYNLVLKSNKEVTGEEISTKLNISMTEALDHLEALQTVGLISSRKSSGTTLWRPSNPLKLEITSSKKGLQLKKISDFTEPVGWLRRRFHV